MNENIENELTQLKKQLERTEMHIYRRMDALEEIFNENPDRVNEAFDEMEDRLKYHLARIDYTDKDLKDLKELSQNRWTALEERTQALRRDLKTLDSGYKHDAITLHDRTHGLEDQIFALGKLAENLEERMRRMEQNWTLAKKQMQIIQHQINKTAPDTEKLPPDWLEQCEVIRDIVNPQPKETEVQND
ncbi:MAG: hypothetical protein LUE08_07125 [Akkermansiaceae bacterium]|nr:hypothetical protein [Akkermansiaceae bacterium]